MCAETCIDHVAGMPVSTGIYRQRCVDQVSGYASSIQDTSYLFISIAFYCFAGVMDFMRHSTLLWVTSYWHCVIHLVALKYYWSLYELKELESSLMTSDWPRAQPTSDRTDDDPQESLSFPWARMQPPAAQYRTVPYCITGHQGLLGDWFLIRGI